MVDTASPDVRKVAWKKRQSMAMALDNDSQGDPDEVITSSVTCSL